MLQHIVHLGFKAIVRDIIQVEVQAGMNDLAMKAVIQMVIGKEGGNFIHPFQMNRYICHRWSDNLRPEFPRGGGLGQKV